MLKIVSTTIDIYLSVCLKNVKTLSIVILLRYNVASSAPKGMKLRIANTTTKKFIKLLLFFTK
jgi:hypothetical protein